MLVRLLLEFVILVSHFVACIQRSYTGSKFCLSVIYNKNVLLHIPRRRIVGMAMPKTTKRCTDAVCKHAAFLLCLLSFFLMLVMVLHKIVRQCGAV